MEIDHYSLDEQDDVVRVLSNSDTKIKVVAYPLSDKVYQLYTGHFSEVSISEGILALHQGQGRKLLHFPQDKSVFVFAEDKIGRVQGSVIHPFLAESDSAKNQPSA